MGVQSQGSVQSQVSHEAYYGTIPMLRSDRIYGFWDTILVTGGCAIATWCYVQGAYVGTVLNFWQAITNTMFGMILAGLFIYLVVLISTRHGIDTWIYQKAVYGYSLFAVVFFLSVGSTWGYEATNCNLFATSMLMVGQSLGATLPENHEPLELVFGLVCLVLGLLIAMKGPVAVRTATKIMVPCLFAVGVFIMVLVFLESSPSELQAITPLYADYYDKQTAYTLSFEWNIAFIFAWAPVLGVIPRLVKTERKSFWGHLIGYSALMAWFICIGAMTSLLMGSQGVYSVDPTEWLLQLAGSKLGLLSFIFIGFANVTTQAVCVYSLSVSTKIINNKWDYRAITITWSVLCGVLVVCRVWEYYTVFVSFVGALSVPLVTLILVDYYAVRRGRFSLRSLYRVEGRFSYRYSKGFNLVTLACFCLGIVCYFLVYDPIGAVPRSPIFYVTTASGLDALVAGGSYWLLSRVPAVRRYLMKDQEEPAA